MKIVFFLGVLTAVLCVQGQAQSSISNPQLTMNTLNVGSNLFVAFETPKDVEGVVTLLDEYVPGKLVLTTGEVAIHDAMNYNAYSDEVAVIFDGNERRVASSMVKSFQLFVYGDTMVFTKANIAGKKITFVQQLTKPGKVTLLRHLQKKIEENDPKDPYSSALVSKRLVLEEKFYIQTGSKFIEIRNKKTFVAEYQENSEAVKAFIKQEKIDFKSASDLKRLVTYLNTLNTTNNQ
jgi:hypothetical protein